MSVFVIAEMGSCHEGSVSQAKRIIDMAARAGADAVKGQYWSNPERMARRRKLAQNYADVYRRHQMPQEWLDTLHAHCLSTGVEWMCSTFLPEDVDTVAEHVRTLKVASFEAGDLVHMQAHVQHVRDGKRLIVSCGLGVNTGGLRGWLQGATGRAVLPIDLSEIATSVRLLWCVSAYPAPLDQLHLEQIRRQQLDGFSDHSTSTLTGALAVAAGARVVEKHVRLDDTSGSNPDYPHALNPTDFVQYVSAVREAEAACRTPYDEAAGAPCEADMRRHRAW